MNASRSTGEVTFHDLDEVYFADSCDPLTDAAQAGSVELKALARGHYPGRPFQTDSVDGVRTLGFWDAPNDQEWGLDWHRNEGIELTYLAKGNVAFSLDDGDWDLHAGHLTVTRPWQRHRVGDPKVDASNLHWLIIDVGVRRPNETWRWPSWIALDPPDLARLTVLLQQNEQPVWTATPALGDAFLAATALVSRSGPGAESELRIRISMLLLELLRTLESQNMQLDDSLTTPQRGVRMFLADLEDHLDRRWTLGSMAASCAMGRTQFSRHCQELTNMTPNEFLSHARINLAKRLLQRTDRSITDIAVMCGFDTPQYFSTRFRKLTGQSPADFRKELRSRPGSIPVPRK